MTLCTSTATLVLVRVVVLVDRVGMVVASMGKRRPVRRLYFSITLSARRISCDEYNPRRRGIWP